MFHSLRITAAATLGIGLVAACSGPQPKTDSTSAVRVYRVQLQMTEDKKEATRLRRRAQQWWENQPPSERPPLAKNAPTQGSPVVIDWKPPFYRVRIGPFATRRRADSVLKAARPTFPEAFIAPKRLQDR